MPLRHDASNASRSRNIEMLIDDGYPRKQAVAIAYRIQRQAGDTPMRRHSARRNPPLDWMTLLLAAGAGAAVGAYTGRAAQATMISGGLLGAGIGAGVGGVAALMKGNVTEAVAAAALLGAGVGGSYYLTKPAATTPPTTGTAGVGRHVSLRIRGGSHPSSSGPGRELTDAEYYQLLRDPKWTRAQADAQWNYDGTYNVRTWTYGGHTYTEKTQGQHYDATFVAGVPAPQVMA